MNRHGSDARAACRYIGALASSLVLCGGTNAIAGPWPQPEGHGLWINTFGFSQTSNYAGIQNPAYGDGTFRRFEISSYGEYGLTDQITLSAAAGVQLRQLDTGNTVLSTGGVGDIETAARAAVWQSGGWTVATQGVVKVPTGYSPTVNPALGNGQVDLEPRMLVGRGFTIGAWPAFADIGAGYRFRLGTPSDQARIDGSLGIHPAKDWLLMLQSYNIIGMRNEESGGTDFDLSTLTVSVVHNFSTAWAVQLGGSSEIASRNFNRGNGGFVAVWWRF